MIHVDDALWFLMEKDPGLTPYSGEIRMHMDRYNDCRWHLAGNNSLADFANGYNYFGFHRTETGWVFREWLPGADAAWLSQMERLAASHRRRRMGNHAGWLGRPEARAVY